MPSNTCLWAMWPWLVRLPLCLPVSMAESSSRSPSMPSTSSMLSLSLLVSPWLSSHPLYLGQRHQSITKTRALSMLPLLAVLQPALWNLLKMSFFETSKASNFDVIDVHTLQFVYGRFSVIWKDEGARKPKKLKNVPSLILIYRIFDNSILDQFANLLSKEHILLVDNNN